MGLLEARLRTRFLGRQQGSPLGLISRTGIGCEGTVDDVVLTRSFSSAGARLRAILLFHAPPKAHFECDTVHCAKP